MVALHAGVFEPKRVVTADGFERTFQVNVLSPYLLTGLLLPRLASTSAAAAGGSRGGGGVGGRDVSGGRDVRVLNISSNSQTPGVEWDNLQAEKSFSNHDSYCRSKTCMKLFSFALHERIRRASASGDGDESDESGEEENVNFVTRSSELAAAGAAALGRVAVLACDPVRTCLRRRLSRSVYTLPASL
jgi:hypothetical protein